MVAYIASGGSSRIRRRVLSASALAGLALGCAPRAPQDGLPDEIVAYLDGALAIMQQEALNTADVGWEDLRFETLSRADGATTPPATYEAIRYALSQLGDGHSFLQISEELRAAEREARGTAPEFDAPAASARPPSAFGSRMQPEGRLHEAEGAKIATVFMPQGMRDNAFATRFQARIAELDAAGPCGWIVDLRGNGGGDMWPMLAGLGPLLGNSEVGGSIGARGDRQRWLYDNGDAIHVEADGSREVFARLEAAAYRLPSAPPVAVLIDRGTGSSGEAMAVAFRGRASTRLFGEPTYGASTSTQGFRLPDGANLVIAVATFVDRDGNAYPSGVQPDEPVAFGDVVPDPADDPGIAAASRWLAARPGC